MCQGVFDSVIFPSNFFISYSKSQKSPNLNVFAQRIPGADRVCGCKVGQKSWDKRPRLCKNIGKPYENRPKITQCKIIQKV
jgi:hypothetical protein